MNLSWKDISIVGAFLLGAVFILIRINSSTRAACCKVSTNLSNISTVSPPALPNDGGASSQQAIASSETTTPPTITPEGIPLEDKARSSSASEKSLSTEVLSPVSNQPQKSTPTVTVAKEKGNEASTPPPPASQKPKEEMKPKTIAAAPSSPKTTATVSHQRTIPTAPTTNPYKTAPLTNPPAVATSPGSTFYLIAASRENFEEAQKSLERLKGLGYNPMLLTPIKSKGINNYRIAIYRSADKKQVEDYNAQINGKAEGFWVDQR